MEAKELRVGNLISYYGQIITVDGVDDIDVFISSAGDIPLHSVNPIELTPEWLEKLGFNIKKGGISYDKDKLCLYFGNSILSGKNGRTYFNSCAILEHTPKYVHQLQNLYYALTGLELTTKII